MTYTTEERITVENVRSQSRIDVIAAIAERRQKYEDGIRDQKAALQNDIAAIKTAAKDKLSDGIAYRIEVLRSDANDGGDNDE